MKVLLVDEEPEILDITELYLKKIGEYEIKKALSVKEAMAILEAENFDAIVSDYEMPEIDGLGFLRSIKKVMPSIPFIFYSGKAREDVIIEAFRNGADGFVQKGSNVAANFAELSHQIGSAVLRHIAEDELKTKEYAIEHSINGVAIADYDSGQIVYSNRAALEMFGYSRDEISSIKTEDFLADGNYGDLRKLIASTLKDRDYFIGELRVKRKDGSEFHISVSITTFVPGRISKKMIFLSFIDITEKVETKEEFLRFLLEASRRIKEPVSLIGVSLEEIASGIEEGTDPEELRMKVLVLKKNAQQVVKNLNELNKVVTDANETISDEYRKFLVK